MKLLVFISVLGVIIALGLAAGKISFSYFSDSAVSDGNVFAASAEFPQPSPTSTNHIVISEVQLSEAGAGNTDHDFIELYNPTDTPYELNSHRLIKRSGSAPTDTTIKAWEASAIIPAHGFYLWSNSEIASAIGADTSTGEDIAANNG